MSEVFLRPADLIHPGPNPVGSQGPFVRVTLMASALLVLAACAPAESLAPLPKLSIDPARVSVSGISSGAYMATQVHVALSDQIHGMAAVAGGPYGCANGKLDIALSTCMKSEPSIDVAGLSSALRAKADAGQIDPVAGLDDDPILILHGANDGIVSPKASLATAELYAAIAPEARIEQQADLPIGHLWPTAAAGDCSNSGNHVADCGINLAKRILDYLTPGGVPPMKAPKPGELLRFDQNIEPGSAGDAQLGEVGYLYVPDACRSQTCGLHVVFHGCEMNVDAIDERLVGLTDWHQAADAAQVVVLYPQTKASFVPLNPKGCWDWWGYTGSQYDTRDGAQVRWLQSVFKQIGR